MIRPFEDDPLFNAGQATWRFNTPGMYRAKLAEGGQETVSIFKEER